MEPIAAPDFGRYRRDWPVRSFLARISAPVIQDCCKAGDFYRLGSEEVLIREGAADRSVFLLVSGCVKVTSDLSKGGTALLAVRIGGDVVGEVGAIDHQPRSATVQVSGGQAAVACVVDGPRFCQVLARYPGDLLVLTETIGVKLRAANRRRIDFVNCRPVVRIARVLVELAEDYGRRLGDHSVVIGVNLKQIELGSLVGVSKPTAERVFRELREAGLVTARRRPVIHNIDRLRVLAQLGARAEPSDDG